MSLILAIIDYESSLFCVISERISFFFVCYSCNINAGDRLRVDLRRKNVPATKMAILEQKFDESKAYGQLKPTALNSAISNIDESDNAAPIRATSRLVKRSASASVRKPQTLDVQSKSCFRN